MTDITRIQINPHDLETGWVELPFTIDWEMPEGVDKLTAVQLTANAWAAGFNGATDASPVEKNPVVAAVVKLGETTFEDTIVRFDGALERVAALFAEYYTARYSEELTADALEQARRDAKSSSEASHQVPAAPFELDGTDLVEDPTGVTRVNSVD